MMLIKCHLARSDIEGLGVFASEPVRAGSPVWRFNPLFDILVPVDALAAAPAPTRAFFERHAYEIATFPGSMALDGDDGRFMNHSDEPNLDFASAGLAHASRDIAAGEELTCDYKQLASRPFEMQPPRDGI
ncbi:SET domain-containing protein-lysine N-methyltransferase [soil metagenome]